MNPKSRVKELRVEIDEIKQKMQLSNLLLQDEEESPSDLSKYRQKETLLAKLNSLKSATTQKQDDLNNSLSSLSKKLQSLAYKKQSAFKSRTMRSKYLAQVHSLEQELDSVSNNFSNFSSNLYKRKRSSLNMGSIKNLDQTLNPIESELMRLNSNYNSLKETLDSLEQEATRMQNTQFMLQEDLISATTIQAEMILQREDMEMQVDMLEIQFADEIEYDEDEDEFIMQMLKIKKMKDPFVAKIEKLEDANGRIEENVKMMKEKYNEANDEICSMCTASPGFEELKNVEEVLREKSRAFKTDTIDNIVIDVNSTGNFDLDEQILKLQLAAIEKTELVIKQQWQAEEKAHAAVLKLARPSQTNLDPMYETKKRRYRNKIGAINQWKFEVKNLITPGPVDTTKVIPDNTIIQEFKAQFSSINYKEHKKLESLVNVYMALLDKREKFYKALPVDRKFKEKDKIQENLLSLEMEKPENAVKVLELKKTLWQYEKDENNLIESITQMGIVPNPFKAQVYLAKDRLSTWDDEYKSKSERVGECKKNLQSLTESLNLVKSEVTNLKDSLKNVTSQEYELSSQVASILEQKRADMLSSLQELQKNTKNPEELKMYEMNYKVVEAAAKLEKANKDLKDFDTNIMGVIRNIEQEEAALRKQQQEIEGQLKEVQSEQNFIKEYEDKIRKLDNLDLQMHFSLDQTKTPLEDFVRNEIRGLDDIGMIEGNYLEFVEKSLGKQTSNLQGNMRLSQKKYYRFKLENTTTAERNFYEKIMPLLEGAELYKKLQRSEKRKAFDPLEDATPESHGYAIRHFHLHKSLEKIDCRQQFKPGFDLIVKVEFLQSPKISHSTLALLHSQGHEEGEFDGPYDMSSCYLTIPPEHKDFYYPFTLHLTNNDRIELIAKNFLTFKQWINGINSLVKNKKRLIKLRSRIESYTSV